MNKAVLRPTKNVTVGAAVGALVTVIVMILGMFTVQVPAELAVAMQTLIVFGLQWWTNNVGETVSQDAG